MKSRHKMLMPIQLQTITKNKKKQLNSQQSSFWRNFYESKEQPIFTIEEATKQQFSQRVKGDIEKSMDKLYIEFLPDYLINEIKALIEKEIKTVAPQRFTMCDKLMATNTHEQSKHMEKSKVTPILSQSPNMGINKRNSDSSWQLLHRVGSEKKDHDYFSKPTLQGQT